MTVVAVKLVVVEVVVVGVVVVVVVVVVKGGGGGGGVGVRVVVARDRHPPQHGRHEVDSRCGPFAPPQGKISGLPSSIRLFCRLRRLLRGSRVGCTGFRAQDSICNLLLTTSFAGSKEPFLLYIAHSR